MKPALCLLLGVLASGCLVPVADLECNVDADCAPWMVCSSAGRCVDPSHAARVDAGRDAGAATVDAGLPPGWVDDGGVNWGNVATDLQGADLGSGRAPNVAHARTGDFEACSGCLRAPWNLATSEGQRAFLRARNEAQRARE